MSKGDRKCEGGDGEEDACDRQEETLTRRSELNLPERAPLLSKARFYEDISQSHRCATSKDSSFRCKVRQRNLSEMRGGGGRLAAGLLSGVIFL